MNELLGISNAHRAENLTNKSVQSNNDSRIRSKHYQVHLLYVYNLQNYNPILDTIANREVISLMLHVDILTNYVQGQGKW